MTQHREFFYMGGGNWKFMAQEGIVMNTARKTI